MADTELHSDESESKRTTEPLTSGDAADLNAAQLLQARADTEGLTGKPKSFGKLAWERFLNHRLAIVGAIGLVLIALAFIFAPVLSDYTFDETNVADRRQGPSLDHPFGTDEIGRDLFVRTAKGGRYSMFIGLLVAFVATATGTLLGALSGYFGKKVDTLISQLINLLLIVPAIVVLSVFALNYGRDAVGLSLVIAALLWTRIARVVRGVVLGIKEQEYIMAARAAGANHGRIIFRHLLPNVMGAVAVEITLLIGTAIVLESTLSFLGLGVQPPNASLGTLVADAKGDIESDPIRVLTPGIFIVLIVMCVNFLGDGLRDALDPRAGADSGAKKKSDKGDVAQPSEARDEEVAMDGV